MFVTHSLGLLFFFFFNPPGYHKFDSLSWASLFFFLSSATHLTYSAYLQCFLNSAGSLTHCARSVKHFENLTRTICLSSSFYQTFVAYLQSLPWAQCRLQIPHTHITCRSWFPFFKIHLKWEWIFQFPKTLVHVWTSVHYNPLQLQSQISMIVCYDAQNSHGNNTMAVQ